MNNKLVECVERSARAAVREAAVHLGTATRATVLTRETSALVGLYECVKQYAHLSQFELVLCACYFRDEFRSINGKSLLMDAALDADKACSTSIATTLNFDKIIKDDGNYINTHDNADTDDDTNDDGNDYSDTESDSTENLHRQSPVYIVYAQLKARNAMQCISVADMQRNVVGNITSTRKSHLSHGSKNMRAILKSVEVRNVSVVYDSVNSLYEIKIYVLPWAVLNASVEEKPAPVSTKPLATTEPIARKRGREEIDVEKTADFVSRNPKLWATFNIDIPTWLKRQKT